MTLCAYRDTIARYLLRQSPSVVLPSDDLIWDVVNVAYRQGRPVLWMAGLALMIHHTLRTDDITKCCSIKAEAPAM